MGSVQQWRSNSDRQELSLAIEHDIYLSGRRSPCARNIDKLKRLDRGCSRNTRMSLPPPGAKLALVEIDVAEGLVFGNSLVFGRLEHQRSTRLLEDHRDVARDGATSYLVGQADRLVTLPRRRIKSRCGAKLSRP